MFLDFYGLSKQPFGVTPDPEFLYPSATHREALASVVYGIQAGVGFSAIIAKPGMGKTTLLFTLLRHFQSSTHSALLFDTQCNSSELLRSLLDEFEIPHEDSGGNTSALASLRQFLLKSARAHQRVLVVVDEAQNLDIPVFETLRLLSNFETPTAKLLHIVLAGQPELGRKLALPELEQLRQRITMVSRLNTFAPAEVIRYVVHRLKRAGYQGGPLFTPEALGLLVSNSHGVPREINRLSFNALSLGCALGKNVIDGQLVREATADLELGFPQDREETVHGRMIPETDDALAALFSATLKTSNEGNGEKEEERRIAREQKVQPVKSTTTVAPESDGQPRKTVESVPEQPRARQEERAGAAISSVVPDRQSDPRKVMNAPAKPAAVPARSRQPRRVASRSFAWPASLLLVAAIIFGILRFGNLQGAEMFASQLLTAIQNRVVVWQSVMFQQLVLASKPENDGSTSTLGRPASSGASAAQSKPTPPAATGGEMVPAVNKTATVHAAPAATSPRRHQIESRAVGRLAGPIASAENNLLVEHDTVSFVGTSERFPFVTVNFASTTLQKAETAPASAVVNQTAEPPSPAAKFAAKLIKLVDPVYPEQARIADIAGRVVLDAHIDESGKVREVHAISGNSALVDAAVDAVRQWEYKPSLVNGQPRESDAHIVIAFSLQ